MPTAARPFCRILLIRLGVRRNHHPHRLTLVTSSWADLTEELDAFAKKEESPKIRAAFTARREQAPRIGFIMSGQGPQWWGMGRDLMEHEPVFREAMEKCDAALRPWASFSLLEELAPLRGNVPNAPDGDWTAVHLCDASGARGALEILGR